MIKNIKNKNIKWWFQFSCCVILFSFILIFGYSKINFLIKGVEIKAEITHNTDSSLIQINGNAENSVFISLNGREIFIDKDGNFSEKVGLLPGLSVITIYAKDKFGNEAKQQFRFVKNEVHNESFALKNIESEIIN